MFHAKCLLPRLDELLLLRSCLQNFSVTSITARLQTIKFGQAPILSQPLSSHTHVFIMILWESMNFHPVRQLFQIAATGAHCTEIDFALSFGAVLVKMIDLSKTESRDFLVS